MKIPNNNILINPKPLQVILPTIVASNLIYKKGTEQNIPNQSYSITKNLTGWLVGSILTSANPISYLWTGSIATLIGLGSAAKKKTDEEKKETIINHASWWISGAFGAQVLNHLNKVNNLEINGLFNNCIEAIANNKKQKKLSQCGKGIKNATNNLRISKLNLSKFYGFSIGAAIIGPALASCLKLILTPNTAKQNIAATQNKSIMDPIAPDYINNGTPNNNFNPIWSQSHKETPSYNPTNTSINDPYNINKTFPWLNNTKAPF